MIAHEKIKAELHTKLKEETERMATRLVFQVIQANSFVLFANMDNMRLFCFLSNRRRKRPPGNLHGGPYVRIDIVKESSSRGLKGSIIASPIQRQ